MIECSDWLHDVVLVNESRAIDLPGDITLFRSEGDACGHLEPWWVAEGEGFALSGAGEQVVLGVKGKSVVVVERKAARVEDEAILHAWLTAAATAVLAARRKRAKCGRAALGAQEQDGLLPATKEGLIAYVGFQA